MTEAKNTIELKDSERQPCEVWTRVMGYHRPVQSFNIGKRGSLKSASVSRKVRRLTTEKFIVLAAASKNINKAQLN